MLIIMGLHFKEDACDSDDDMLDDCQYESSFEEEPSEAAVNLNTNVSFNASLYSSSECAQAPLYPGSSVTLLQAVASQFLWFSSNPGISKESLSHPVTVQKYFLPVNNILPNNYEEAYAIIKPFLVDTISFHACPHDCVLFRDTDSYQYSCLDKCPKCGSKRYSSKNIPSKHFLYLPLGPRLARFYGTASLAQVVQGLPDKQPPTGLMADVQQSPFWQTCCAGQPTVVLQPSTDGMNPFNKNKTSYSMWPITLAMLNLPRQIRYLFGRLLLVGIVPGDYLILVFWILTVSLQCIRMI